MNRKYTIGWLIVIGLGLALEIAAFFDPIRGDTLSENVWIFLDGGIARYFLLAGAFIWLVIHFFWKGKAG